jgi:hypothetical protein
LRGSIAILMLAVGGLASVALGAASLASLTSSYQKADIALTETPATFQAWTIEASDRGNNLADGLPERVGSRLLLMPLEKRRDLVVALVQRGFWQPLTPERQTPRALQEGVLAGVLDALHQAPMAGDLYLAAAWLEIRLNGFGSKARALLVASHLFAPRELPVAVERLALAPTIWPLLDAEDQARLKADLETLRNVAPERAGKIEAELAASGVTIP